jgi:hypothetical protein
VKYFDLKGTDRMWKYRNWEPKNYLKLEIKKIPVFAPGVSIVFKKILKTFMGHARLNMPFRHLPMCYCKEGSKVIINCSPASKEYQGRIIGLKLFIEYDKIISTESIADYFKQIYKFEAKFQSNEARELPSYKDFIGKVKIEITYKKDEFDRIIVKSKMTLGHCIHYYLKCTEFNEGFIRKALKYLKKDSVKFRLTGTIWGMMWDVKGRNHPCVTCPGE